MKTIIRLFSLALIAAVFGLAVGGAMAQSYPNKPVTFVVPFPPGSGNDVIARIIGEKLTASLGQPVVVENRLGAGGSIAAEMVAKAAPDGHTIFIASTSHAINAHVIKVSYDLIKDFAPVILVGTLPYVLVVPVSVPAKSIKELVALAKSKAGELNYASSGTGSTPHLLGEMLKMAGGVDIVHVPYKGTPQALSDLLGGRVQILFTTMATGLPHVKAGKLAALGVAGIKRNSALPDVPTMAEAGYPTLDVSTWFAILAPAGTPKGIVTRLNTEIVKILSMPDVKERLTNQGVEPSGSTSEELATFLKADVARWGKVVKDSGVRMD
jgi:tripartite-type tricarboxylate transporter receptor subunit TctC